MKNPCKRECPDRTPGCSCGKREAWKASLEEVRTERHREIMISAYQKDAVRMSRKNGTRRRHRI